ncbi:hypothetical protein LMG28138_00819 [Pararobbsia alpina]|uniref:Uncharacterized protein n=1 Tax=Pararobbsia alpina TaxID=621374 RepID=A0A6S7B397_9BURK|nr:hypothetical protein LMG28138_00819 [Pararobbsia alpina]
MSHVIKNSTINVTVILMKATAEIDIANVHAKNNKSLVIFGFHSIFRFIYYECCYFIPHIIGNGGSNYCPIVRII